MTEHPRPRPSSRSRGQASVLGLILIVGMTVLGVTGVLMVGSTAIDGAHSRSQVAAAEQAMTQLDSRFSLVSQGTSEFQGATVDTHDGASLTVDGDAGQINVSVRNRSDDSLEYGIVDTALGALTYDVDGEVVAYQGGGVWRRSKTGGSRMVSAPEFHYRSRHDADPTLTIPLVLIRGDGSVEGEAVAETGASEVKHPLDGPGQSNPLEEGVVNITIQSEYYEAWGKLIERRIGGEVTYDHDQSVVMVTLATEESSPAIQAGVVSADPETTLDIQNHAEADSYNSTAGDYAETAEASTKIVAAGFVQVQNHATVSGDITTGGSVDLKNHAEVTGNVSYGGSLTNDGGTIGGWTDEGAEVSFPDSVGWLIDDKRDAFESSNDNADSAAVDDASDTLVGCDSTCTLSDGDYILEDVVLDDGELVLDTSSGDVDVVVRGDVTVKDEAIVRVTGDGRARFFVEDDLTVHNHANVTVPGERSRGMWFYMRPGSSASFDNHARFVGVVYGPGSGAQSGVDVSMDNHAQVYGAAVGSVDEIDNEMGLHFDEALIREEPLGAAKDDNPHVTYLHVTVNDITVSAR